MRFQIFTLLGMVFTHLVSQGIVASERLILPYRVNEVVFDAEHSRAFIAPSDGWWIDVIGLQNREVSGRVEFTSRPDSIAIAPNGKHMYVALTKGHVNSTDLMRWGSVAVFELEPLRLLREIEVQIDPDDIVATDGGHLVIAGGSGSATEIGVFSAATGEKIGSWGPVNRGMHLSLHPTQKIVYGADAQGTEGGFHHFNIGATGSITEHWKAPFEDDFTWGQKIFVLPDGLRLLDAYGKLRTSSTGQATDLREMGVIEFSPVGSVAFDMNRHLMAAAGVNSVLFYDFETNEVLEVREVLGAQFVGFQQDQIVVIVGGYDGRSEIIYLREQAKTSEENVAPTVIISPVDTNAVLAAGSRLGLWLEGRDEDGSIISVRLFSGTNLLMTTGLTHSYNDSLIQAGINEFYAVAYDAFGASGTSAVLRVHGDFAPQVQIGIIQTRYSAPETISIPVTATDADGTVKVVRLLVDGRVVAEDEVAPYEFEFTPPRPGRYRVEFEAVDDLGIPSPPSGYRLLEFEGPADDLDLNIFVHTGTSVSLSGSTAGATRQKGEPHHAGVEGGRSVWWAWRAPSFPSRATVTINTLGSDIDTVLAVYSPGTNRTADFAKLSLIAANDDDITTPPMSWVKFTANASQVYYIVVDGREGAAGDVQIRLDFSDTPGLLNDQLASAVNLYGSVAQYGSNAGATKEPGEAWHAGNPGGASVWWRFEAAAGSVIRVSMTESTFDTLLAVYTTNIYSYSPGGPQMAALSFVAGNDDAAPGTRISQVKFVAPKGGRYWVAVDGYNGAQGTFRILQTASYSTNVTNDAFESAGQLTGSAVVTNGTTFGATIEAGEPLHAEQAGVSSVWYRWTAPTNGLVSLSTRTSNFDTLLAVYTGSALSSLSSVAANDDNPAAPPTSAVRFHVEGGTEYFIAIAGYKLARGSYVLALNFSPVDFPRLSTEWVQGALWMNVTDATGMVVVEASTNLVQWEPIRSMNGGQQPIEIVRRPEVVQEFYRVMVVNE